MMRSEHLCCLVLLTMKREGRPNLGRELEEAEAAGDDTDLFLPGALLVPSSPPPSSSFFSSTSSCLFVPAAAAGCSPSDARIKVFLLERTHSGVFQVTLLMMMMMMMMMMMR